MPAGDAVLLLRARPRGQNDRRSSPLPGCPDSCTKFPDTERIAPDVVVVFEVLSSDAGRRDRIEKIREYAAVASILHFAIVESSGCVLLVLHRRRGDDPLIAITLTGEDPLALPEIGIQIPVAEFYEDVDFVDSPPSE